MPLTPQDVSNKRFTPVRVRREGYDMAEVDSFLDEVEAELVRLLEENKDLREQAGLPSRDDSQTVDSTADTADTADTGDGTGERPSTDRDRVTDTAASGDPGAPTDHADSSADGSVADRPAPPATPAEPVAETLTVTTAAEASSAATRLLELATRSADQLVDEAKAEAEQILSGARERTAALESEHERRRSDMVGELDRERQRLDSEVADLRSFEREYRGRLRSYFEQQLSVLDGSGEGAGSPAADLDGNRTH